MKTNFFIQIASNKVLITTIMAWVVAQSLKVFIGLVREKRFNFKWFVGSGGMPSSHVAGIVALATSVGFVTGFSSFQFAIAVVLAIIVMFDAQGVRRAAGRQAEILNKILDDIYWGKHIQEDRLKELLGHTPIQVFAGMIIGILVAIVSFSK